MAGTFRLQWPVDDHTITQRFGENPHIYAPYNQAGHEGLDFLAPAGSNVYACADGDVFDVRPDDGNPYGIHVRIRHRANGREYTGGHEYATVYAHLSRTLVSNGQRVGAGERIALSGHTGHSRGDHLHLTLKLVGAKTSGYPDGVIDPLPYLQEGGQPQPSEPVPPQPTPQPLPAGPLVVYATDPLNVRNGPSVDTSRIAIALPDEPLTVIGERGEALAALGDRGKWLQVLLPYGLKGHVAAWYVQTQPGPATQSLLMVYPTEDMNMRERPAIGGRLVARLAQDTPLTVHDDPQRARVLVGRYDEWLYVQAAGGQWGWVAAWYVQLQEIPRGARNDKGTVLQLAPAGPLLVYATEPLNVRNGPSPETSRIAIALPHEALSTLSDRQTALSRLGKSGEWLHVRLPDGLEGYVAAQCAQREPGSAPETLLTVYPLRDMDMRRRPTVRTRRIGQVAQGTALIVHDDPQRAQALVGRYDEWLYAETPGGQRGWVPAWCVTA